MNYHKDTSSGHAKDRSNAPTSTNNDLIERHTVDVEPGSATVNEESVAADPRTNMQKIFGAHDPTPKLTDQDAHSAEMQQNVHPEGPAFIKRRSAPPSSWGMRMVMNDVLAFHNACSVPSLPIPAIPPDDRKALRFKLIDEEVNKELLPALKMDDLEGIADGIGDAIVVLIGTALEYGIPLDKVWAMIDRANMAKVDPVTGRVRRREDGKILKPDGWQAPDIRAALGLS